MRKKDEIIGKNEDKGVRKKKKGESSMEKEK